MAVICSFPIQLGVFDRHIRHLFRRFLRRRFFRLRIRLQLCCGLLHRRLCFLLRSGLHGRNGRHSVGFLGLLHRDRDFLLRRFLSRRCSVRGICGVLHDGLCCSRCSLPLRNSGARRYRQCACPHGEQHGEYSARIFGAAPYLPVALNQPQALFDHTAARTHGGRHRAAAADRRAQHAQDGLHILPPFGSVIARDHALVTGQLAQPVDAAQHQIYGRIEPMQRAGKHGQPFIGQIVPAAVRQLMGKDMAQIFRRKRRVRQHDHRPEHACEQRRVHCSRAAQPYPAAHAACRKAAVKLLPLRAIGERHTGAGDAAQHLAVG